MLEPEEKGFLEKAIELSRQGMTNKHGGPFGCIIVRNNDIVGEGCNMVIATNDPTAHAEIVAIRDACQKLKTFQLHDCVSIPAVNLAPCVLVLFTGLVQKSHLC